MTKEISVKVTSGWSMLGLAITLWLAVPATVAAIALLKMPALVILLILLIPCDILLTMGFFTLQPNEARVLVLFGQYVGTVRDEGFHWANPFTLPRGTAVRVNKEGENTPAVIWQNKYRVSLRARNFETGRLKVNEQRGNPIDIGAVVVWRIADTAQALFDVDDYTNYINVQSESALRHLASSYPYDQHEDQHEVSLRSGGEAIHQALRSELQERLGKAGICVEETRLTHLAYAQEIAGTMLRRQQAEAIIAARRKIVEGAVSMVQMALQELADKKVVVLDDERKAAMVGNLLVVLCGETEAQPIINSGTLYH